MSPPLGSSLARGAPVDGVGLGIAVEPARARLGKTVQLDVGIENTGSATIQLERSAPLADYEVRVVDDRGNVAPLSATGSTQTTGAVEDAIFRLIYVELAPGELRTERYNLTDLSDLTSPGSYDVEIRMPFSAGVASAGPVRFTIV